MGHGFSFFDELKAGSAAGLGFAVEGLGDDGGAAHFADTENLDLERAGIVLHLQQITDPHFAGGFGGLAVGFNSVEITGACGE